MVSVGVPSLFASYVHDIIARLFRFDELHPSEQTDRVVAREVAAAIRRKSSKWTTWFS